MRDRSFRPAASLLLGALLVGTATLGSVGMAWSASAASVSDGLEVSLDGIAYTQTPVLPLFDGSATLIPGESISAGLWVRNTTDRPVLLRLSGIDASASSEEFADALSLTAVVAGDDAAGSASFTRIGSCLALLPDRALAAGEEARIDVTLAFAQVGAVEAQGATADVSLRASLRDASAPPSSRRDCPAGTTVPVLPSGPADEADPSGFAEAAEASPAGPARTGSAAGSAASEGPDAVTGEVDAPVTALSAPAFPERAMGRASALGFFGAPTWLPAFSVVAAIAGAFLLLFVRRRRDWRDDD